MIFPSLTLLLWISAHIPTAIHGVPIELSSTKVVIESINGGCIGIDGGEVSEGARLVLVDCNNSKRYDDTVWLFDEETGIFRSDMDHDYCWSIQDRKRALRLRKCKQVQSSFEFYENEENDEYSDSTKQIRFKNNQCVVHRGVNANVGKDHLIVKQCESINNEDRKQWNILQEVMEDDKIENPKMEFANPFDVDVPYFSGNITKGYSGDDLADFDKDLAGAAGMILNKVIQRNIDFGDNEYPFYGPGGPDGPIVMMQNLEMADSSVAEIVPDQDSSSNKGEEVTDYETNVQEEGVDEADIMKADENNIYASYGDYILVWDKNGNIKAQLKMPEINVQMYWNPKPYIDSLLLVPGYLVVFVSGYGDVLREENLGGRIPILYNYLDTQIRVYSTTAIDEGKLELKAVKNINGRFVDARLVEGRYVHAVTISGIDTYQYLTNPLERYQKNFGGLSDQEYYVTAQEQVREEILPQFIKYMNEELSGIDGDFPEFLQINQWQKDVPDDQRILGISYGDGIINNVASVVSFDVTSANTDESEGEFTVSTSSFMTPYSWMHMYGTDNEIILATEGWNWNPFSFGQEESTYIIGLALDGANTEFISVGTIAGRLLNSFALDIHEGELRVATTIQQTWRWRPFIADESFMMAEIDDVESEFIQDSSTENYVIAFNLQGNADGEMEETGRVKIGEPNESIFSIRFFDDFAYVVTFERTDPFYVIGLNDGVPVKLGEFKLNGFSSYLHPMTPDNRFLIGVGQNATDDGRITGLMITIFNASIPEKPFAVVSHTVENDDNRYSSSDVEWEHKSFRYLQKSGKLILPLSEYYQTVDEKTGFITYENFQGFAVFDVTMETIDEKYRVSHKPTTCSYCSGYLSPRSFVYEGNLMTVRESVVKSTDLENGEEKWSFEIEIDGVDEFDLCCPYYYD